MLPQESIIVELEEAVRTGTSEKRVNTLRQVTNRVRSIPSRLLKVISWNITIASNGVIRTCVRS